MRHCKVRCWNRARSHKDRPPTLRFWVSVVFDESQRNPLQHGHFFLVNPQGLVGGWAYPSEKYEFVSWDDEIPNIWKKTCSKPATRFHCFLKIVKIPCWPVFAKSSAVFDAGSPMVFDGWTTAGFCSEKRIPNDFESNINRKACGESHHLNKINVFNFCSCTVLMFESPVFTLSERPFRWGSQHANAGFPINLGLARPRRGSSPWFLKIVWWLRGLLVGGIPTPLRNMKVGWNDSSQYMESHKTCLKPPTRLG